MVNLHPRMVTTVLRTVIHHLQKGQPDLEFDSSAAQLIVEAFRINLFNGAESNVQKYDWCMMLNWFLSHFTTIILKNLYIKNRQGHACQL